MKKNIAVIGSGSWGTALALVLGRQGYTVRLWGFDKEEVTALCRDKENTRYLPGHPFPETIQPTSSLAEALQDTKDVLMVVPSHGFRAVFRKMLPLLADQSRIISASKGIESGSLQTMVQIMEEESRQIEGKNFYCGALSGPSFAKEVAAMQPTAVTIAFADQTTAESVQQLFASEYFRVYSSTDMVGLELAGAMKNIIAIAAGICDGLGYGLNTRAALITRGLAEMTRLGVTLGASQQTFAGLGGLGDLVLTCTGGLSRNRTFGLKMGEGKTREQALAEMTMVAEGVITTKSCYDLAQKHGVDMPILEQVYAALYEDKPCDDAVKELFQRDLKEELA